MRGPRVPRPQLTPTMLEVPRCWFRDALNQALKEKVKPPTAWTRRKLVEIKLPCPEEIFQEWMQGLQESDAEGIERAGQELTPTQVSASGKRFIYLVKKAMVIDRLFALEETDFAKGPFKRERTGAWRRGMGCCRLNLSSQGHKRGRTGRTVSLVAGALRIRYRVPSRWRSCPELILRFFVFTMDQNGHINWPADFSDISKAKLRKLARLKVQAMLDDAAYPIDEAMRNSLANNSGNVLTLRASPHGQKKDDEGLMA